MASLRPFSSALFRLGLLTLAGSAALPVSAATATTWRVTVDAGDVDRAGVVATFKLPASAPPIGVLRDAGGHTFPFQVDVDGTARFLVPAQKAGQALELTLEPGGAGPDEGVIVSDATDRLSVIVGGQPAFDYWMKERPAPRPDIDPAFLRSGFIHPVLTPAGVLVTDSYAKGHLHHQGIWAPWTKTKFQGREPDFWNMGAKTGKVEFAGLDRSWSGPVHGGFVARQRFIDLSAPAPTVALNEVWEITSYDLPGAVRPVRIIDLKSTQTCATADPLILPEYRYGGLGYRGHELWNGAANAQFVTSEGVTDRQKANTSRERWIHIGGLVNGQLAGTAILGHPENFRAPQPLRVHPTEPFICFAPMQAAEFQIEPGKPYVARYRFVIMDGPADAALLEAYWQGYAKPATAKIAAR